jgi:tRNA nucleotidyltransferase/poly(A) polymerase
VTIPADIRNKPPCSREDAMEVLRRLRDAGHVTYFAGGCVRDLLLGIEPKDYDIATDAPPPRVRKLFPRTQAVGAAFGVVLVRQNQSVIEVATFRSDGEYLDGRRPETVRFTRAEEDAQRRDFTINGLFLDPLTNSVVDYVGGQADLAARRLRAIGDPRARFREDHLRMLRAVRFAARLGFEIESATADALRAEGPQLKRITPERIAEELRMMLIPSTRAQAWKMLWQYGLITELFRHFPGSGGEMIPAERSIFLNLPATSIEFSLALAAAVVCYRRAQQPQTELQWLMAEDDVKRTVRTLRQTFRLSNSELDAIEGTFEGLGRLLRRPAPTLATLKRFLAMETSAMSIELMRAVAKAGVEVDWIAMLERQLAPLIGTEVAPPPLLTGDDLTALGYQPGPLFKRVLTAVYDEQLEGRITNREEAIEAAKKAASS